jgi:hypothetical protein
VTKLFFFEKISFFIWLLEKDSVYLHQQNRKDMDELKNQQYTKSYIDKENYITSHIGSEHLNIPKDKSFDFVDMAYDYLDTLGVDTLMLMSNKDAWKGYKNFVEAHCTEYEIDNWGERINK